MRYLGLAGASASAMVFALLCSAPAQAQETSQTSSSGERYEYADTYEYGEGSTTYNVNFRALIGSEEIEIGGLSRYFEYFTPEEIAAFAPPGYDFYVEANLVSITGWSAPQYVTSEYTVIDIFSEETYYNEVASVITTQTTSGDAPDAVVPVGWRGNCYFDGASGPTNYSPFGGEFAGCDYAESYFEVAPGTINTNTHTTYVSRQGTHYFQVVDDAYTDYYLFVPTSTATTSSGTLETTSSSATTIRNDSYQVELTGVLGGNPIFSQTLPGQFGDSSVQAALTTLARPRGYGLAGTPVVLVWSTPVQTGTAEELTSSASESTTETTTGILETTTVAYGGLPGAGLYIGDRGACTDAGTSGTTNGTSPTGANASCEGGAFYSPNPGVTNTNRHTTYVTNTHTTTVTTENWLSTDSWELAATAVPIGQIHSAVRDALFEAGGSFARRHNAALAARDSLGFGLWTDIFTGKAERDTDGAGPGSEHSAHGIAGGASFRLSGIASVGLAASHETTDSDLPGLPERADLTHTQLGLAAELSPGAWRLAVTAGRGWAEIDTERGGAGIGGVARASYDAQTWFATAEAGPEFGLGPVTVRPLAGIEWTRATLGDFAETGGIALVGTEDSASRLAASLGAQAAVRWSLPGGPAIRLWADARGGSVIDGEDRDRAVAFAGGPGGTLHVTTASEGDTYAEGRVGVSLVAPGGLGFHLGTEGRTGGGISDWRASAGVSAAF